MDDSIISLVYQGASGAPIALFLMILARANLAERSWLTRFVVASGNWSYTLYILHSPVLIVLRTLFGDGDPNSGGLVHVMAMFTLYFILTNAICWAIALVFERPSDYARLIRNCIDRCFAIPTIRKVAIGDE
jgi:peptidoglycan/LPS O-acetylase OafA/YrhL